MSAFVTGLDHPRGLYVLPNGGVLVAETNGPTGASALKGIKGAAMGKVMDTAGAAVPSTNRISPLGDGDGDGVAEIRSVFLTGLKSPFGMVLVEDSFYVANADSLLQFPYHNDALRIDAPGHQLADLPHGPGPLNHHWTRSLVASADGNRRAVTRSLLSHSRQTIRVAQHKQYSAVSRHVSQRRCPLWSGCAGY